MATVTLYPSSVSENAWGGTWTNPENMQADVGNVASVALDGGGPYDQAAYDFGAAGFIDAGATINSVSVTVEWRVTVDGLATSLSVLSYGSNVHSCGQDLAEPTSLTQRTYTLLNPNTVGGDGWTAAHLRDELFSVSVEVNDSADPTARDAEFDFVRITVDFTPSTVQRDQSESLDVAAEMSSPEVFIHRFRTAGGLDVATEPFWSNTLVKAAQPAGVKVEEDRPSNIIRASVRFL